MNGRLWPSEINEPGFKSGKPVSPHETLVPLIKEYNKLTML